MSNQEIINYILHTPYNTNPVILKQMLKQQDLDSKILDFKWNVVSDKNTGICISKEKSFYNCDFKPVIIILYDFYDPLIKKKVPITISFKDKETNGMGILPKYDNNLNLIGCYYIETEQLKNGFNIWATFINSNGVEEDFETLYTDGGAAASYFLK